MRDRLADGHATVAVIDLAAEEDGIDFCGHTRRFAKLTKAIQSVFMMLNQFIQPFMRAAKRDAMCRTNQRIFRQGAFQLVAAINPVLQGVAFRFCRPDGNIGTDIREQLISGEAHIQFRAPETGMFRGVSRPNHDFPQAPIDIADFPFCQAVIAIGERRNGFAKSAEPRLVKLDLLIRVTRFSVEIDAFLRRIKRQRKYSPRVIRSGAPNVLFIQPANPE